VNKYEAICIFPEALKDNELQDALNRAAAEIKKLGGEIEGTTRLGKRVFARTLKKQNSGHYAMINFQLRPPKNPPEPRPVEETDKDGIA